MKGLSNKMNGFRLALLITAALMFVSCTVGLPLAKVSAAGEGYFTLENETLYAGAEASQLNFTLMMHNESGSRAMDLNNYGVRITGGSAAYPASLTMQYGARVKAGDSRSYNYSAMVPANVDTTSLEVTVFQWDSSSPSYMRDVVSFPFKETAVQAGSGQTAQTLINLKPLDATLPQGASAAFQLGHTYSVNQAGQWMLDTELWVTNIGDSSFKLPATLSYRILDSDKNSFTAGVIDGADKTLLPGKPVKLTLQTPVTAQFSDDAGLTLQVLKSSQSDALVMGSLSLKGSLRITAVQTAQTYDGVWQNKALALTAGDVTVADQEDGQHIRVKVTAKNTAYTAVALPTLAGSFQFGADGYAAASAGTGSHPSYLPPGTSAVYYFTAVLPKGIFIDDVQLVTYETKGNPSAAGGGVSAAALQLPVLVTPLKGANVLDQTAVAAQEYKLGTSLPLEASQAIDSNLQVALGELSLADTDEYGYRTAVAKFKITNTGSKKLNVPNLSTELAGQGDFAYEGVNIQTSPQQISPKTSVVAIYTYVLPPDEGGKEMTLSINDDKAAAPDKISLGRFKVTPQGETDSNVLNVYPFKIDMASFFFYQTVFDKSNSTFNYNLRLNWQVSQEQPVIVNSSFPKLEVDLLNAGGKILGTNVFPFTGTGKLENGEQRLAFPVKSDESTAGLQIKIYETITTPEGTVKRLIRTLSI